MIFKRQYLVSCRCLKDNVASYFSQHLIISGWTPFNLYVDEIEARRSIHNLHYYDSVFIVSISRIKLTK